MAGFHSHAYMPAYLQYIHVAMSTVGSEWHSVANSELASCTMPPMVGGDDSTVVGILLWLPVCGEKVGKCVQDRSVSGGQGTSYSCTCHSTLQFVL